MPTRKDSNDEQILADYEAGMPIEAIAAAHGVSIPTVQRRTAEAGIRRNKPGTVPVQVVGEDGLRPCSKCRKRLTPDAFHFNKARPDGLNDSCRECWAKYQRERTLLRKFGISLATFDRMLKDQNGGCALCEKPIGLVRLGKKLNLSVDHCHRTGVVRGLLCSTCNFGIGLFKDDPDLLRRAADYLTGDTPTLNPEA